MLELDLATLDGGVFSCRPDCGLCCFASPAISPSETQRLVQLLPSAASAVRGGHLLSRTEGGACRLLVGTRCSAHPVRPLPCALYPITVHLSVRAQATAVLTCPGFLWGGRPPGHSGSGAGLDRELDAAREALRALDDHEVARVHRGWRRALASLGVSDVLARPERAEARRALAALSTIGPDDPDLPSEEDGLDLLPLFFDPRLGIVALANDGDRIDLLQLHERGGVSQRLATLARATLRPRLTEEALGTLQRYRDLLVDRDATVGAAAAHALDASEEALLPSLVGDLRSTLASALARAVAREQLHGRGGSTIDAAAILEGIRATDADVLDRPTVGRWM